MSAGLVKPKRWMLLVIRQIAFWNADAR